MSAKGRSAGGDPGVEGGIQLELSLNTEKSKLVNVWEDGEGFDFLGHHLRRLPVKRKGVQVVRILRCFPSQKAMKKMKSKVKACTSPRALLRRKPNDLIVELNPKIRGWRNYYAKVDKGMANGFLAKVDWYIRKRLMIFCRKKYKRWSLRQSRFFQMLQETRLQSATTWTITYCAR